MQQIILPISYLGSLDYYLLLTHYDTVVFEKWESYPKQTLRNRCTIFGANGPQQLSIPVKYQNNELISKVRIDYSTNWQHQHWQAIQSAYRNTPFFEHYEMYFKKFYTDKTEYLIDFTTAIQSQVLKSLSIKIDQKWSEDFTLVYPNHLDYRNKFKPSKHRQLFKQNTYYQIFAEKWGPQANCSIIDLLFHEGPQAKHFLANHTLESLL